MVEKKWKYNWTVHTIFRDLKRLMIHIDREVLYNTLTVYCTQIKLVTLTTIYLNETYSEIGIGKNLSGRFPLQKQEDASMPLLFDFTSTRNSEAASWQKQSHIEIYDTSSNDL
jgi:hypothetical protein